MTRAELKKIILECCNDVLFTYGGKEAGITSEVKDYVPTFHVWYGSATKKYSDVDDLMNDPFFGGKSLNELIGKIEILFA